jgi:hypothetical protein
MRFGRKKYPYLGRGRVAGGADRLTPTAIPMATATSAAPTSQWRRIRTGPRGLSVVRQRYDATTPVV